MVSWYHGVMIPWLEALWVFSLISFFFLSLLVFDADFEGRRVLVGSVLDSCASTALPVESFSRSLKKEDPSSSLVIDDVSSFFFILHAVLIEIHRERTTPL